MSSLAPSEVTKFEEPRDQPPTEVTPMQMIYQASRDPNCDPDKLDKLVALHERMQDRQKQEAYAMAMVAAQVEMPTVIKDAQSHTNTYARLETVQRFAKPVYLKHGFAVSFTEEPSSSGKIVVICKVTHKDGHTETFRREGSIDKSNRGRTEIQSEQSTVSYLRRHMLLAIFGITVADEDDDGRNKGGEPITEDQRKQLHDLLIETKSDIPAFLKHYRIEELALMEQGAPFNEAMRLLQQKKAKAGAR